MIEAALKKGLHIHLRIIVDKNNLDYLPDLIRFLDEKEWLDNPKFRMHVGRIYECGAVSTSPYKEKYYITLLDLIQYWSEHASQLKGVEFGFRGIDKALNTGKVPSPLFSYCPSCTNEFVFDLKGDIYPCPGGCGDLSLKVGTFYPHIEYFDTFYKWRSRTILRMEKCQHCDVALVCGGGCPLENLAEGKDIFEPACVPAKREMQIGVNILYPQMLQVEDRSTTPVKESCCGTDNVPERMSRKEPQCNCTEVKIIPLDE
ncbi:MAG: SPASM domain-containing protein [Theionarchaea archaeon]|nr:SPASM domain-containing protein [Theionarchaea archaeon]